MIANRLRNVAPYWLVLVMIGAGAHAQNATDNTNLDQQIEAFVKDYKLKKGITTTPSVAKSDTIFTANTLEHPYRGANAMQLTDTSPLIEAIAKSDLPALRSLVKSKPKLNENTVDGSTALIVATINSNVQVMQFLIASGADVIQRDSDGLSALHYAAIIGDPDKVKLLASLDPLTDRPDNAGITPLYYAYLNDRLSAADVLINDFGARINQQDAEGNPLAFLVVKHNNNPAVAQHMIQQNLNLFKRNTSDQSLIGVAKKAGNKAVAKTLKTASDEQIKAFLDKQKAADAATKKSTVP